MFFITVLSPFSIITHYIYRIAYISYEKLAYFP